MLNGLWLVDLVLLYLLVVTGKTAVSRKVYYVTAYPNGVQCPTNVENGTVCNDLSVYLSNMDKYFTNNTDLIFLNGTHLLPTIEPVVFENLHDIRLSGASPQLLQGTAELQCNSSHGGGLLFLQCTNVSIDSITVSGCTTPFILSGKTSQSLGHSLIEFGVGLVHSTGIDMINIFVINNPHSGLFIFDSYDIGITGSKFVGNGLEGNYIDSNIKAMFIDNSFLNTSSQIPNVYYLNVLDSTVAEGIYGLNITVLQTNFLLNINLRDSKFMSNFLWNIALISLASCQYTLTADTIESSHSQIGGGFILLEKQSCATSAEPSIAIHNSTFSHNKFNCFIVAWLSTNPGQLNVTSTRFFKNTGFVQSTLLIDLIRHPVFPESSPLQVRLTNLTFDKNEHIPVPVSIDNLSYKLQFTSIITNVRDIEFKDCNFTNNIGSAIFIYNSFVRFIGVNRFENNTSIAGGGLSLVNDAFLIIDNSSRLVFINNHATEFGGAIHVSQLLTRVYDKPGGSGLFVYCFFQLLTAKFPSPETFYFENNTAAIAGSALYGDVTRKCLFFGNSPSAFEFSNMSDVFFKISTFVNQSGYSVVSSGPRKVCFCNNNQDEVMLCHSDSESFTAFPGSYIKIPVVIVGSGGGFTPGLVQITDGEFNSQSVNTTSLNAQCSNVTYYVISKNVTAINKRVFVSIAGNISDIEFNTLEVNIHLDSCRKGFYLSSDTGVCECVPLLKNTRGITCFNAENLVQRSGKIWIGYDETLNCTIVNLRCPFSYCKFSSVNVTVSDPDKSQCNHNRIGQLCGKCPSGLSLTLGVNSCADCSNSVTILMIIPFALAGIVLVLLLFFLNTTVSTGTVNGLIFFANIVKILEPLLPIEPFPFLAQFISWMNLDFGVTMCFYNGLNACQKIGLQFVFPFYLWLIMLVIIVLCRRFTKLANSLGSQTVPVLATLLLLSYTKMLRTVILIFSISHVTCDGKTNAFWLVDPTIRYCTGCHLPLFLIGAAVMGLVIAPFTFFLIVYPLFESLKPKIRQKCSWLLFLLKPFFDAYRGPHNSYFYFYPGLLLLVRIFVALVVGIEAESNTSFDILLAVSVILITLLSTGLVYKSGIYIHIIDVMFILGLIVLVYATDRAYSERFVSTNTAEYGTLIVLLCSFFMFLGIIHYHVFVYSWIGNKIKKLIGDHYIAKKWRSTSVVNRKSTGTVESLSVDPEQIMRSSTSTSAAVTSSSSDDDSDSYGPNVISQVIEGKPNCDQELSHFRKPSHRDSRVFSLLREPLLEDD